MMSERTTKIFADEHALVAHAAEWLVDAIAASQGTFAIALSGGNTPRPLYERLATPELSRRIDWARVHLFWGDERFVPYDSEQSNYRMAKLALIDHVAIPAGNVHPVPTDGTPHDAARRYAQQLQEFYGADRLAPDRALLGVNLLGMGDDGHTASLFPGAPQLGESQAWAVATTSPKGDPRISLTLPVLSSASSVVFMVAGASKHQTIAKVFEEGSTLPAARVHALKPAIWMMDRAAAPPQRPTD
jgi:6-phosphogluconolactonase